MTRRRLLLGPPGTGKTTRLLNEMGERMDKGLAPERIAFVSFTRAAVHNARKLTLERFDKVHDDQLQYFRTLHSLAFHQLGLRRGDVFGRDSMLHLSEVTGEELTGKLELDAPTLGERGDALLFLDQYSRSKMIPLKDAWQDHTAPIDWFRLKRFVDSYKGMRESNNQIDFTDMLEKYHQHGAPVNVDLVLVDEAQDLTPLQWRVVERAFGNVPEIILAGDDDQGIYHWAGASADDLLAFDGEREILGQSHRLPRKVWQLASEVSAQISRRFDKPFMPSRDDNGVIREGFVDWLAHPEEADLSNGTWLLLARTRRQLAPLAAMARNQGVSYVLSGKSSIDPGYIKLIQDYENARKHDTSRPLWHDALTEIPLEEREYLLSCLRRGEKLTKTPRVRIDTIHGAKGLEADSVLLMTDLNERVRQGQDIDPDAELRVLYVAVTRAIHSLFLVVPQGRGRGYQL